MSPSTRGMKAASQDQNPLWIDPALTLHNANANSNASNAQSSRLPPKSQTQSRRQGRGTASKDKISPERARQLERNRIAANKCREKGKNAQAQMEHTLETATAKNQALVVEVSALKDELWHLKNELLNHAHCDDRPLDPTDPQKCPSPSFSVSTWSDDSIIDPGIASKASMDEKATREFYGDGLFDSFVDVPNI